MNFFFFLKLREYYYTNSLGVYNTFLSSPGNALMPGVIEFEIATVEKQIISNIKNENFLFHIGTHYNDDIIAMLKQFSLYEMQYYQNKKKQSKHLISFQLYLYLNLKLYIISLCIHLSHL